MQQIYRRTPMPKSDFNKVAKLLVALNWLISYYLELACSMRYQENVETFLFPCRKLNPLFSFVYN